MSFSTICFKWESFQSKYTKYSKSRLDFLIHIIITEKHSKGLHYYMCKTSYYLLLFLLGYFITYLTKLHFIMTSQNYNGNLYLLNNGKKNPKIFLKRCKYFNCVYCAQFNNCYRKNSIRAINTL